MLGRIYSYVTQDATRTKSRYYSECVCSVNEDICRDRTFGVSSMQRTDLTNVSTHSNRPILKRSLQTLMMECGRKSVSTVPSINHKLNCEFDRLIGSDRLTALSFIKSIISLIITICDSFCVWQNETHTQLASDQQHQYIVSSMSI